jgi:subtilisin family serine protease
MMAFANYSKNTTSAPSYSASYVGVRLLVATIIFFTFATSLGLASGDSQQKNRFVPGKIIVKWQPQSSVAKQWNENQRSGTMDIFTPILGEHETTSLLSSKVLHAFEQSVERSFNNTSLQNTSQASSSSLHTMQKHIEGLYSFCVITYTAPFAPDLIARKISVMEGIVYAEPMPRHILLGEPNDPEIDRQYYLPLINAFDSWDALPSNAPPTLIAIVDTGIDRVHPDLENNIYTNPGESGTDDLGADKRFNGRDDDNNGFIDDVWGWDFVSSQSPKEGDNTPLPGNRHGTHVAGIAGASINNNIGIAGVAQNVRLLAVKVGPDESASSSVENEYDGLVYAGAMNADVINCSWGSSSPSQAAQEIVDAVTAKGSLIVAAAGNNGRDMAFFPAAYNGVLSVASVSGSTSRSSFSNYHGSVDISAPGSAIFSTVLKGSYALENGTSMASPVVAGVATMVAQAYPEYTPLQITEHLKATSLNIDNKNLPFRGKLGGGLTDAHAALTRLNVRSLVVDNFTIIEEDNDGVLEEGEQITLLLEGENVLQPVSDARISLAPLDNELSLTIAQNIASIGALESQERFAFSETQGFQFRLPDTIEPDYLLELQAEFFDGDIAIGSILIPMIVNPTYRTIRGNKITTTFNSRGNIGYNDFPENRQGEGFRFRNGASILFEGAFMISDGNGKIVDVSRDNAGFGQSRGFKTETIITTDQSSLQNSSVAFTAFHDKEYSEPIGLIVEQEIYQPIDSPAYNSVIIRYKISNTSSSILKSLYAGNYFDWDVGSSSSNNIAEFLPDNGIGLVRHYFDSTLPLGACMALSELPLNFTAIDNSGTSVDNPGVYDGFTREEKLRALESGLLRTRSNVADVSYVMSAGPFELLPNETREVAFALMTGLSKEEVNQNAEAVRIVARSIGIKAEKPLPLPQFVELIPPIPNPAENRFSISFKLPSSQYAEIILSDASGKVVKVLGDGFFRAGTSTITETLPPLSSGVYYVRLRTLTARTQTQILLIRN